MNDLHIDSLRESDIPAALRLSTQAGWNQLDADWRRLVAGWPETCLAGRIDDQLIATATLTRYPTAGWVGMVLVDEQFRSRGIGGKMFDAILQVDSPAMGLDASDLGRPVYAKRGFAERIGIDRWTGPPAETSAPGATRAFTQADWDGILELDRRAVGIDRATLLRQLQSERGAAVRVIGTSQKILGFGLSRPGRTVRYIGPVIAEDQHLAATLAGSLRGHDSAIIDVPSGSRIAPWLAEQKFTVARRLVRMTRPADAPLLHSLRVFAAAGFELG